MSWDPHQYLAFADARLRPAIDLLGRVPNDEMSLICDLGCGPGNSTALLANRWPEATIVGVDDDAPMLERARQGGLHATFVQDDIGAWTPPEPPSLIYSNAALHWLDDHATLFPNLMAHLRPGGVLAVQMPRNHAEPSHALMHETALDPRWSDTLAPLLRPHPVAVPAVYHSLLSPLAQTIDIWETIYTQVLSGPDPVLNWIKGSALKPLLDALDPMRAAAFETELAVKLRVAYPPGDDGRVLFPFRRLFIVAQKRMR